VNQAELNKIFNSFNKINVLIIGDLMLDSYYWGDVSRISPEAPVPIVSVRKKESRLGGAGNVAVNIQAMGATPYLCGIIGDDDNGDKLVKIMQAAKLPVQGLIRVKDRPTTTKTRIISSNHHIVRIDEEVDEVIGAAHTEKLFAQIEKLIITGKINVIIFEDYDKGAISVSLIDKVIALAKKLEVPTVVDPKKRNFLAYRKVTLFKPNLKELKEGLGTDVNAKDMESLRRTVEVFRKKQDIDIALITLSEHGVYVNSDTDKKLIPAHIRNISDVSGAGDTVVSVAALCCALGLSPTDMAYLSNLAGGQVCEKSGVVPVNKEQLLAEAKQYL